jgi:predicted alpha/beta superfamily hydrolase
MSFQKLYLFIASLSLPLFLSAQLVLQLNSIPSNTPAGSDIYVAGSFNNWSPDNNNYILQPNAQDVRRIELDLSPGMYEYKFTRGGWATVEGTAAGGFLSNRMVQYNGGLQVENVSIAGWEGQGSSSSTAAANVEVLSESFYMPQLNRNRKIWIYLPPDYYTSDHSYPVMYMQDGQNLFDANTSAFGEWEVDESLNTLFDQGDDGIIIIGINNGGGDRLDEYTPWANPQYGGGEGSAYVDFLVQDLKPYVDNTYRTLSDQPNTGIMGSSLGGLISLYAGIRHQDIFGKVGVLSPSLWFTGDIYEFVYNTGKQADLRIAMLGGQNESSGMVPDMQAMYNQLRDAGFAETELSLVVHPDGAHSEWYWRREFPDTYEWLFEGVTTYLYGSNDLQGVNSFPNPATDQISITGLPNNGSQWNGIIYDTMSRPVQNFQYQQSPVQLGNYPAGTYYLVVFNDREQWAVLRFQRI